MYRLWLAVIAIAFGSAIAYAQIINPGGGGGNPGGSNTQIQYNTNSTFGGISGITSDSASIGIATPSQLILYGFSVGDCVKIGASNQLADFGAGCGGSGSPGGSNSQVQFNTAGSFGGIGGATSNGSNISFTTNSLVINGLAVSGVSGTTGTLATVTGALASNCVRGDGNGNLISTGVSCATQVSTPSIAAGSNITTSGTSANVTVNVIATPSFTTVIASGNLTAGSAQFTGQVTGTSAVFQTATVSNLTPTGPNCVQETGGVLQATNTGCATQVATPSIAAGTNITTSGTAANTTINVVATPSFTTVIASGNLTAGSAQFSGQVTGTNAVFQTLTVSNLTPTGPNCLQETAGVLQATNTSCATQVATPSIAAGSNITTSGTAANTTVNVVATPSFTTVIATGNITGTTAQFSGFLTAGGASLSGLTIQTATFSSNLTGTTANFSSNLTANIAQFPGFLSAGGASLSGLTIQTETLSSNLTGTTANFSSNLTANIAAIPGFLTATGVSFNSLTVINSLTGSTGNFTSTLTASIYTGTGTGAGTLSFITPGISEFGLGSPAAANTGWLNWGGESRLAADKGMGINSAALTPTGLAVSLQGGRTYSVDADLYVSTTAATGGIQVSLTGTYGSTDTHYFGYIVDGGTNTGANGTFESVRGASLATAKNAVVGNVVLSGTTGYVSIKGTISASSPGTLVVAAAQTNTVTVAQTTLTRGSRILVHDMP